MKARDASHSDSSECPDEAQLEAHWRGELDSGTAKAVAGHLKRCERCRVRVTDNEADEQIGELLREARRDVDPEVRRRLIRTTSTTIRSSRNVSRGDDRTGTSSE